MQNFIANPMVCKRHSFLVIVIVNFIISRGIAFLSVGGEMSRPLHTSALNSPPHTLHHRSARSPSVLVQSTRFHLQTSSQLPYKHDRLSDFLGTLLIVVYIAVTVKEWCRLFGLDSSLDGAGWLSLAVVASSTNEPNVAPIFQ